MTYPNPYDYRTPAEKLDDLMWLLHERGECMENCRFPHDEIEEMAFYLDQQLLKKVGKEHG